MSKPTSQPTNQSMEREIRDDESSDTDDDTGVSSNTPMTMPPFPAGGDHGAAILEQVRNYTFDKAALESGEEDPDLVLKAAIALCNNHYRAWERAENSRLARLERSRKEKDNKEHNDVEERDDTQSVAATVIGERDASSSSEGSTVIQESTDAANKTYEKGAEDAGEFDLGIEHIETPEASSRKQGE